MGLRKQVIWRVKWRDGTDDLFENRGRFPCRLEHRLTKESNKRLGIFRVPRVFLG